jgi:hypothetical protein
VGIRAAPNVSLCRLQSVGLLPGAAGAARAPGAGVKARVCLPVVGLARRFLALGRPRLLSLWTPRATRCMSWKRIVVAQLDCAGAECPPERRATGV